MNSIVIPDTSIIVPDSELITEEEFIRDYERIKTDPLWRITSGKFYKIMIKGDDEDAESFTLPFRPNASQLDLLHNLWWRNIILKARQLGFTTLIAIVWLDHALWNADQRCGIIAHEREAAEAIFRDKIRFAYNNLPSFMQPMFPLERDSAKELLFGHNNSSIRVATSMRSGTIHRLHVSEFGKIAAKYPEKAREVATGSIPAVPLSTGILVIESTAEGASGRFHDWTMDALKLQQMDATLTKRQYRLHFYPWFENPEYRMDNWEDVTITDKDNEYFDEIEAYWGIELDMEQCAWYVATRDADFRETPEDMWREYPSYPEEAFKRSMEGTWFRKQMSAMRKEDRIKKLPILHNVPCWTFWDIGNSDGTAIWVIQRVGYEFRCINHFECWGEPYAEPVKWLQSLGLIWEKMYLPHDADHVRQGQTVNKSPLQMLQELMPGVRWEVLPRIDNVVTGISQTRDVFPLLYIDKDLKEGIEHLDGYKKTWNTRQQTWTDVPYKLDGHSETADALRQFGQAYAAGLLNIAKPRKQKKPRSWRSA